MPCIPCEHRGRSKSLNASGGLKRRNAGVCTRGWAVDATLLSFVTVLRWERRQSRVKSRRCRGCWRASRHGECIDVSHVPFVTQLPRGRERALERLERGRKPRRRTCGVGGELRAALWPDAHASAQTGDGLFSKRLLIGQSVAAPANRCAVCNSAAQRR